MKKAIMISAIALFMASFSYAAPVTAPVTQTTVQSDDDPKAKGDDEKKDDSSCNKEKKSCSKECTKK